MYIAKYKILYHKSQNVLLQNVNIKSIEHISYMDYKL